MWIDSEWELPCNQWHPFFGLDDTGVYMDCEPPGYLGVYVDIDPNTFVYANITPESGQSVWSNGWNHLVATWSSSPPSLSITLNGAVGQTTTSPWSPPDPVPGVVHVTSSTDPALASIDDVAVWTRQLSPTEIQTIYLAGASVGDLCKLP
jgi:Concanavalin A-like lectin/glucanases superfamily